MKFELLATSAAARRGRLSLPHGEVDTPAFMPVGTYGAVKTMAPHEIAATGAQILLGNTFHLWLRPGLEVIEAHGGLHQIVPVEIGLQQAGQFGFGLVGQFQAGFKDNG